MIVYALDLIPESRGIECKEATPGCLQDVPPGDPGAIKYKDGKRLPICSECADFTVKNGICYWQKQKKNPTLAGSGAIKSNKQEQQAPMVSSADGYVKREEFETFKKEQLAMNDLLNQRLTRIDRKLDELGSRQDEMKYELEQIKAFLMPPKVVPLKVVNQPFDDIEIPF